MHHLAAGSRCKARLLSAGFHEGNCIQKSISKPRWFWRGQQTVAAGGVYAKLCIDKQLADHHLPAAWLAAATIHLGERPASFDRDFRKLISRSQFTLLDAAAG